MSIIDVIKLIKKEFPDATIINLGETNSVIEYSPKLIKKNICFEIFSVVFVCMILFMGASTAIMSFHTDADIYKVFKNYYKIFFGVEIDNPKIIVIPYSIGLASGITIFFNHLFGKQVTRDLTPIEVEISLYENDIYETTVDLLEKNKKTNKKK